MEKLLKFWAVIVAAAGIIWGAAMLTARVDELVGDVTELKTSIAAMEEERKLDQQEEFEAFNDLFQKWYDRFGQ